MSILRKILVRAPKTLGEQTASLAALDFLYNSLEKPSIEIVVDKDQPHIYEYADFIGAIHLLAPEKDGALAIFPWVHGHKDIFNITTFVDFRSGASSASLGIALKARERIGFTTTLTRPMYTHGLSEDIGGEFLDERFLKLVEHFTNERAPIQIRGKLPEPSEKEKLQLQSLNDYIFVAIRASEWSRHQKIWSAWFDELAGGRLIVCIDQDNDDQEAQKWLKARENEKFYIVEKNIPSVDLILMHSARGILTDSAVYGNISAYYGLRAMLMAFDLADYPSFGVFSPRPEIFVEREGEIKMRIDQNGERIECSNSSAIDAIFQNFNL